MPVSMRGGAGEVPFTGSSAMTRPPRPDAFAPGIEVLSASSVSEFHEPQDSQRPLHFGYAAPQDWQT
jgi:hypothetical protein